ncbi:MAG: hypothetical protein ACJAVI_003559 [Candidatus Azotimanducaceae bacterium]|jgi:hypothetical protein
MLNFIADQMVANNVIAPIDAGRDVCFYANVPSDIFVDITGYLSREPGYEFAGATLKRFIDSRLGVGPPQEHQPLRNRGGKGVTHVNLNRSNPSLLNSIFP